MSSENQPDVGVADVALAKLPIAEFTERAYLHYAMYVILDRALPHLADGLKPVQRRIIYAMSELGLHATAKFKKSARSVGDVLGKFHPHGDTACYEAMVLMAQPFSYRYPLLDGQGNWGSQDEPKSFAAMRYTEARLTAYAQSLLAELQQGTVDWKANFDGTLQEPKLLPARLPNVLVNGASGIAVGMATDIPPHNLREVAQACILLLDNPNADLAALCEHVQGPDYPTAAEIITTPSEILEIYRSGHGSLRQRAVWQQQDANIIISALPYQVSGARVLEQIAAQMTAKKLPLVTDLRDESDHISPTRLLLVLRSNRVAAENLMQHLFATTDLERSYRINLNIIAIDGRPRVFDLKTLLSQWLDYRLSTVTRRLQFEFDKIAARAHILQGLLVAFLNLDQIIHIIRSEDHPKEILMKQFELSKIQAEAILELKLRHLARLEELKISDEQVQLEKQKKHFATLLKSKRNLKKLVRDELLADAEKYGDSRTSPLVIRQAAKAMPVSELTPTEAITVVLSKQGWVRAAKGNEIDATALSYKAGDEFLCAVRGRTNQLLLAIDSFGKCYALSPHSLPSARSFGEPLSSSLKPQAGAVFCGLMLGNEASEYLLCTDVGGGFVAKLGDLHTRNKAGKSALRVPSGSTVLVPKPVFQYADDWLGVVTSVGRLLIFTVRELERQSKGTGTKLINIPKANLAGQERVVDFAVFNESQAVRITSGKRHHTLKPAEREPYLGARRQRGSLLPRGFRQVQKIEAVAK